MLIIETCAQVLCTCGAKADVLKARNFTLPLSQAVSINGGIMLVTVSIPIPLTGTSIDFWGTTVEVSRNWLAIILELQ